MIPVQVHLVLNHVPLVGLVFGLIFSVLGMKRSSPQFYLAGLRIFWGMGVIAIPIVLSGLRSADALSGSSWLNAIAVARHQRAGMLTLVVLMALSAVSETILFRSHRSFVYPTKRVRTAVRVIASVGLGVMLWTSSLGGELRHTELKSEGARVNHQPSIELTSARREG